MGLTRRARPALATATLLAAAAVVDGTQLWRAQRWNAVIASGAPSTGVPSSSR